MAQTWRMSRHQPATRRARERIGEPLDEAALDRLALNYLGRYATTRAKLADYLRRKLRERGWGGETPAPVEAIVARCAALGYVDDAAFAAQRGAALARRGYGARRVVQALQASGVSADVSEPVRTAAVDSALETALAFARRKRIGPFAERPRDEDQRRRDFAALVRAGHPLALARLIVRADPGEELKESA